MRLAFSMTVPPGSGDTDVRPWSFLRQFVGAGWASMVLASLAIVVAVLPGLSERLQFDRTALASGEWWRLFSGHFVHWNADHLFWDLVMFAILGFLCEQRSRRQLLTVLLLGGAAIPLAIVALQPEFTTYRGLSGIDTGLFTLLAAQLLDEKWRSKHLTWVIAISGLLLGLVGKIGFELATSSTIFVDATAAGFIPVPLAHLVGAIGGFFAYGLAHRQQRA